MNTNIEQLDGGLNKSAVKPEKIDLAKPTTDKTKFQVLSFLSRELPILIIAGFAASMMFRVGVSGVQKMVEPAFSTFIYDSAGSEVQNLRDELDKLRMQNEEFMSRFAEVEQLVDEDETRDDTEEETESDEGTENVEIVDIEDSEVQAVEKEDYDAEYILSHWQNYDVYAAEDVLNYANVTPINGTVLPEEFIELFAASNVYESAEYTHNKESYDQIVNVFAKDVANYLSDAKDESIVMAWSNYTMDFSLFAANDFADGALVGVFAGEVSLTVKDIETTWAYPDTAEDFEDKQHNLYIDGSEKSNIFRFLAHDETENFNVEAFNVPHDNKWHVAFRAIKKIEAGDELLLKAPAKEFVDNEESEQGEETQVAEEAESNEADANETEANEVESTKLKPLRQKL